MVALPPLLLLACEQSSAFLASASASALAVAVWGEHEMVCVAAAVAAAVAPVGAGDRGCLVVVEGVGEGMGM